MKITVRHMAWRAGRAFTLGEARKPGEKKIFDNCPFEYTETGSPDADKKHENGRRMAWLAGAFSARADHVAPSKRHTSTRHPRAQARHEYQQRAKLQAKGYKLAL